MQLFLESPDEKRITLYGMLKVFGQQIRFEDEDVCRHLGWDKATYNSTLKALIKLGWVYVLQKASADASNQYREGDNAQILWLADFPGQIPPPSVQDAWTIQYKKPLLKTENITPEEQRAKFKGTPIHRRPVMSDPFRNRPTMEKLLAQQAAYYPPFDRRHPDYRRYSKAEILHLKRQWEVQYKQTYIPLPDFDLMGYIQGKEEKGIDRS